MEVNIFIVYVLFSTLLNFYITALQIMFWFGLDDLHSSVLFWDKWSDTAKSHKRINFYMWNSCCYLFFVNILLQNNLFDLSEVNLRGQQRWRRGRSGSRSGVGTTRVPRERHGADQLPPPRRQNYRGNVVRILIYAHS